MSKIYKWIKKNTTWKNIEFLNTTNNKILSLEDAIREQEIWKLEWYHFVEWKDWKYLRSNRDNKRSNNLNSKLSSKDKLLLENLMSYWTNWKTVEEQNNILKKRVMNLREIEMIDKREEERLKTWQWSLFIEKEENYSERYLEFDDKIEYIISWIPVSIKVYDEYLEFLKQSKAKDYYYKTLLNSLMSAWKHYESLYNILRDYSDEKPDKYIELSNDARNTLEMSSYLLDRFLNKLWDDYFWPNHDFSKNVMNSEWYKKILDKIRIYLNEYWNTKEFEVNWYDFPKSIIRLSEEYNKDFKTAFWTCTWEAHIEKIENWRILVQIRFSDKYDFAFTDENWNRFKWISKVMNEAWLYAQEKWFWEPFNWVMDTYLVIEI